MDGSNNPNNDPSQGQGQQPGQKRDLIYAERMRQRESEMLKERQALAEMAKPYNDYATRAAANAFPDTQNLFYSIMGINVAQSRERVKVVFAELCGLNGRELEPPVVNAVAETYRSINKVQAAYEWGLFIGITAVVFRGWRRKLSYGLSGPQRYWYPATRIVGYGLLGFAFVTPTVSVLNKGIHAAGLAKDARLQGLKLALHHQPEGQAASGGTYNSYGDTNGQSSASYDDASPSGSWQAEAKSQVQEQATAWRQSDTDAQNSKAGWSQSSSGQGSSSWSQSNEPAPIQTNSAWDSADPIDDASPVAGSASSSRSDSRPGESSWERLRRQAGLQSRQPQGPPQSRQPPPSQGGWGENTDTSSQFGGSSRSSRDDYSYSSADLEKSTAKDQAQREFDQLLDRERKGVDQENKRWK